MCGVRDTGIQPSRKSVDRVWLSSAPNAGGWEVDGWFRFPRSLSACLCQGPVIDRAALAPGMKSG